MTDRYLVGRAVTEQRPPLLEDQNMSDYSGLAERAPDASMLGSSCSSKESIYGASDEFGLLQRESVSGVLEGNQPGVRDPLRDQLFVHWRNIDIQRPAQDQGRMVNLQQVVPCAQARLPSGFSVQLAKSDVLAYRFAATWLRQIALEPCLAGRELVGREEQGQDLVDAGLASGDPRIQRQELATSDPDSG